MRIRSVVHAISKLLLGDPVHRLQLMIFREAARGFVLEQSDFPRTLLVPRVYGQGLPERVVELLLVRTTYLPGARVLDVGHSNIMECHRLLLQTLASPKHLIGIDIASPTYDTSVLYEQSIQGDITSTPFPSGSFDVIWCVSTLEHVGMDNSVYTKNFASHQGMDRVALREMVRLLAPGGTLLVTVPFGLYENHGWFRNYDAATWQDLLSSVRGDVEVHELYFGYAPDRGWEAISPEALSSTEYHAYANAGAAGLAVALIRNRRNPAKREGIA